VNRNTDPKVEGVAHYDAATLTITFRPTKPLEYGMEYIIDINGEAFESLNMPGYKMMSGATYTIGTEPQPPAITLHFKVDAPAGGGGGASASGGWLQVSGQVFGRAKRAKVSGGKTMILAASSAVLEYPLPKIKTLRDMLLAIAGDQFAEAEVVKMVLISQVDIGEILVPLEADADVLEIQDGDTVIVTITADTAPPDGGAPAGGGGAPAPAASLRVFERAVLEAATKGFHASELISDDGGFGPVYHGIIGATHHVAVKVMREHTMHNSKQLEQEIATLQQCRHSNLVPLIGICTSAPPCIVYEHMSGGSLFEALRKAEPKLAWRRRLCILLEIASGLEYLHTSVNPPIVHRDIKSANVLLSATLQASIGDFGLARICPEMNAPLKAGVSTRVFGTPGYIDPEYAQTGQVKLASDMYSLGIVALELLYGAHFFSPLESVARGWYRIPLLMLV
jgi:hypothetical protein